MPNESQPNKPKVPTSTALKLQVVRPGRRVAGIKSRAQAPAPFMHSHPLNANAPENVGVVRPMDKPIPSVTSASPPVDPPAVNEEQNNG